MNELFDVKALGRAVNTILVICGSFSILVIVSYVIAGGWSEAAVWGAFGDYVGGLLNPVFGFVNVIVLIVISYQIASIENSRAEKELATQREIALYSLRHESFQKVNGLLDQVHLSIMDDVATVPEKMRIIKVDLGVFIASNVYLFPNLTKYDYNALSDSITKIQRAAEPLARAPQGNSADEKLQHVKKAKDAVVDSIEDFGQRRIELMELLLSHLMDNVEIEF